MKKIIAFTFLLAITSFACTQNELSTDDLLSFAMSSYDKEVKMNTEEILGTYQGEKIKVIYPCGDICPNYTKRIIHYSVELMNCSNSGGVEKDILVQRGRASSYETFCLPTILVENWDKVEL